MNFKYDRITYTIQNVFEIFFLQDMENFITFKLIYVYQFIFKKNHRKLFKVLKYLPVDECPWTLYTGQSSKNVFHI